MNKRAFLGLSLAPLLLGTTCAHETSFYIANMTSSPVALEVTTSCTPCLSPSVIGDSALRRGDLGSYYRDHSRPAPMTVEGRVDSLVTYRLMLPPDTALLLFDRWSISNEAFAGLHVRAATPSGLKRYDMTNIPGAFQRWHKHIYVLELQ